MIKVLIVEDNEINRALIKDILSLRPYALREAADAGKGLDLGRAWQPDLILMDLQLPGTDGIAATRALKSDPVTRDIPIIALTSYAFERDRKAFLEAGGDAFLTKPIDVDALLETVDQILAQK